MRGKMIQKRKVKKRNTNEMINILQCQKTGRSSHMACMESKCKFRISNYTYMYIFYVHVEENRNRGSNLVTREEDPGLLRVRN